VEYSVNGGGWQPVAVPSNDPAVGCAATDDVTGYEPLSCTATSANACGYGPTTMAYTGPLLGGTGCNNWSNASITPYAHRCHGIPNIGQGSTLRVRWRFTSDEAVALAGFYLDDVAISNAVLPNACTAAVCATHPDGTPCDDGNACTAGETCAGGSCAPGSPVPPPAETAGVLLNDTSGTTLSWTAAPGSVVYDVASGTLDDLRTGGTVAATCVNNDGAAASFADARPDPPPGGGWYYLIRAQSACGTGTYGFNSASVERSLPAACP